MTTFMTNKKKQTPLEKRVITDAKSKIDPQNQKTLLTQKAKGSVLKSNDPKKGGKSSLLNG